MKITDLAHKLEPFINKMIEEYVSLNTNTGISGGTAFLPREHAIWLLDSGGAAIKDYSADSNGFDSANADATSGDIIWVPACTIAGGKTIDEGVKVVGASRYATIFSGQITLDIGSTLENLSVIRTSDSGATLEGVVGPGDAGTAYVNGCDIKATNAGAGDVYAVNVDGDGDAQYWNCFLYGSSGSGDGYAMWWDGNDGNGYIYGGRCYGSEEPFNNSTHIFTSCVRLN